MMDCETMRDRMPEVARGVAGWSAAEAQHFAGCAECAAEWRVVRAGIALHADLQMPAERIAAAVMARLHEKPAAPSGVRRLPWRGALVGLLAAAASIAIVLWSPISSAPKARAVTEAVVPELRHLSETELETVLTSMQSTEQTPYYGKQPHFDDLTDDELAQLLSSGEDL